MVLLLNSGNVLALNTFVNFIVSVFKPIIFLNTSVSLNINAGMRVSAIRSLSKIVSSQFVSLASSLQDRRNEANAAKEASRIGFNLSIQFTVFQKYVDGANVLQACSVDILRTGWANSSERVAGLITAVYSPINS